MDFLFEFREPCQLLLMNFLGLLDLLLNIEDSLSVVNYISVIVFLLHSLVLYHES